MTEHNEDRRQLDESMTNLPELAAKLKRTEELKKAAELTSKLKQEGRLKKLPAARETSKEILNSKVSQGLLDLTNVKMIGKSLGRRMGGS